MDRRWLLGASALNVGVHVAEVALAATAMAPGGRDVVLQERMAWLATHPPGWTLGWAVWGSSAVIDVLYVAALGAHVRSASRLPSVAVGLVAVGAAVDLSLDVVHVVVNPELAAGDPALFVAFERAAWAIGAAVANPFYCAGTVVVTAALAAEGRAGRVSTGLAAATALFGASLSLAAVFGGPETIRLTAGPTIAAFVAWTVSSTRDLLAREGER